MAENKSLEMEGSKSKPLYDSESYSEFAGSKSEPSKICKIVLLVIVAVLSLVCIGLAIGLILAVTRNLNKDKINNNNNSINNNNNNNSNNSGVGNRKPVIGMLGSRRKPTDSYPDDYVPRAYGESVLKAGGIPIILPPLTDFNSDAMKAQFEHIDGLICIGGVDVDPSYYNETPEEKIGYFDGILDRYQIEAILHASSKHIPILGICRGHQIINVAFGGSLWQDLSYNGGLESSSHRQPDYECTTILHKITLEPGALLAKIYPGKSTTFDVNSAHHQAIKKLAEGFSVDATAPDGIIESIHREDENGWILGVQFHPEMFTSCTDEWLPIFKELLNKAEEFMKL